MRAQHYTAELDVVLALFSTGPVGLGDGLGFTNATRAKATCTADGTLLQPDKALTPLDWSLLADRTARIQFADCAHGPAPCAPQLLQTHTRVPAVDGRTGTTEWLQWHHVVAVAVRSYALSTEDLWPALPLPPGWSYAVMRRSVLGHGCVDGGDAFGTEGCATSTVCPGDGGLCLPVIDTQVGFWDKDNLHIAWAQYLLAPCAPNGWCLLGEMDKYNPASRTRLESVSFGADGISVRLLGVQGESVLLYAITPQKEVRVNQATIEADGTARTTFA